VDGVKEQAFIRPTTLVRPSLKPSFRFDRAAASSLHRIDAALPPWAVGQAGPSFGMDTHAGVGETSELGMVMPLSATFDYVVVVPDDPNQSTWTARLRAPAEPTGNPFRDDRLAGYSPVVRVVPAGMTPDEPASGFARVRPKVLRSRITLTPSESAHARAKSVALYVDEALTAAIRPRDVISISRTGSGGVGLSVVRDDKVAIAVGAVTSVPLGPSARARIPSDLIRQAEDVFQQHDPQFQFPVLPVEIQIGGARRLLFSGGCIFEGYQLFVEHGYYRGLPGIDECVAISSPRFCSDVVANCSAQLLDYPDPLEMEK
jgi:hypothetical protein